MSGITENVREDKKRGKKNQEKRGNKISEKSRRLVISEICCRSEEEIDGLNEKNLVSSENID